MAGQAIIPTNKLDPTGVGRRVKGAQNNFAKRIRKAYLEILKVIEPLEYEVLEINLADVLLTACLEINESNHDETFNQLVITAALNKDTDYLRAAISLQCEKIDYACCELSTNESFYEYKLNPGQLANINQTIRGIINNIFMVDTNGNLAGESRVKSLWLMSQYVEPSYIQGTAQEMTNLANQSQAYALTRPNIETLLFSEPYQRRIGLLAAREFELMQGFTDDVVKSTQQILSSGMAAGQSPTVVARSLKKMFDVKQDEGGSYRGNMARANRIARTEIVGAARTARLDESMQADKEFGFNSKLMHISALVPTTRHTHAALHGELRTQSATRAWYLVDGNSINCLCNEVTVLLDDEGIPLNTRPMKQAKKERKARLGF